MSAYKPVFKGPIEGWVVNHMAANFWRVERTQCRDDVMQDAYIVFARVAEVYPGVEAKHFMALFKRSWTNHFTDLANEDTQSRRVGRAVVRNSEGQEQDAEYIGETDNDGVLATMLRQAPEEVTAVLALFLNAPSEILELALASWKGEDRRMKSGGSKKICQMLGLPEDLDVMRQVEEYFHRAP